MPGAAGHAHEPAGAQGPVSSGPTPEIARDLFVSESTVKTHVARVFTKLGLRDRAQAVIYGYETGLVTPGGQSSMTE
jgi:hypothetical protein